MPNWTFTKWVCRRKTLGESVRLSKYGLSNPTPWNQFAIAFSLSLKVVQSQYTLKVLHSLYSQSSAIQQLSKFYIPYTLKVVQSSSSQSVTFPIYIYILKVLHSLYFCDLSWTLPICIFLGALKVLSKCSHSALKMHFFPFTPFFIQSGDPDSRLCSKCRSYMHRSSGGTWQ